MTCALQIIAMGMRMQDKHSAITKSDYVYEYITRLREMLPTKPILAAFLAEGAPIQVLQFDPSSKSR